MNNDNMSQSNGNNIQNTVANPNANVNPTPMPATVNQNYAATQMNNVSQNQFQSNLQPVQSAQPTQNVQTQNVSIPASVTGASPNLVVPPSVPTSPSGNEVTVINTTKSKTSNIFLIILVILLILFVLNIDTIIKYYDNYVTTGSLKENTNVENTDNLVNGYILVNDSNGSIKLNSINFYNFRKNTQDMTVTFNYLSSENYSDSKSLDLYIELYNPEKELLYKSLFNTDSSVEKDSVRMYTLELDNYVFSNTYYALVKTYTQDEKNKQSTLKCTFVNDDVNYEIVYNFLNDGLTNYIVNKELINSSSSYKSEFDNEYTNTSKYLSVNNDNNKLTYSVDLNNYNNEFNPLYTIGTTSKVVKVKEELKKWICE